MATRAVACRPKLTTMMLLVIQRTAVAMEHHGNASLPAVSLSFSLFLFLPLSLSLSLSISLSPFIPLFLVNCSAGYLARNKLYTHPHTHKDTRAIYTFKQPKTNIKVKPQPAGCEGLIKHSHLFMGTGSTAGQPQHTHSTTSLHTHIHTALELDSHTQSQQ